MKTYKMRNADLEVSRIALGCMRIGGSWDRTPATDRQRKAGIDVILAAYDEGINMFDHADIYAAGKSEEVFSGVWDARPGIRDKIIIQSKCGIRPGFYDFSYEHIVSSVEGSLRRLKTEYLDILLLHRPDILIEPEEVARAFDHLQRSGKVRYFGVSNHNVGQMILLKKHLDQPLVANQLQLSLLHSYLFDEGIMVNRSDASVGLATGIVDYCRLEGILIQAWSPVDGGRILNPPPDADDRTKRTAHLIAEMAERKGTSKEAIALGWILRHPAGIQPIIGTTNPDRVKASCLADQIELSREEWYELFTAARGNRVP